MNLEELVSLQFPKYFSIHADFRSDQHTWNKVLENHGIISVG